MIVRFIEVPTVTDGVYLARVKGAKDYVSKSKEEKMIITFTPYDEDDEYEDVYLWLDSDTKSKSVGYKLLSALGIEKKEIETDSFNTRYIGEVVEIEVKVVVADDKTYFNITDIYAVEDTDEYVYEDELEDDLEEDSYEEEYEEDEFDEEEDPEDDDEEEDEEEFAFSPKRRNRV